ncbi:hypothetical protein ABFA25_09925 [Mycobacterium lepromatosis]|uniref:hypothetical protein n=2 Tax=Mycobacterium lepromatosis TaxID=480418 RepID=UPI000B116DBD|nr:hypothetical protein [Mycobacterium lepromatosis]
MFARHSGTLGTPALALMHDFPTSGIGYFSLTYEQHSEFVIFLPDLPGHGLSGKLLDSISIRSTLVFCYFSEQSLRYES